MAAVPDTVGTAAGCRSNSGAPGQRNEAGQPGSPRVLDRNSNDDEILGLGVRSRTRRLFAQGGRPGETDDELATQRESGQLAGGGDEDVANSKERDEHALVDENSDDLRDVFESHPAMKQAWEEAQAFRESFSTPEEARSATKLLADVERMDALFFSDKSEDHIQLARLMASLDAGSFASLVKAMSEIASESGRPSVRERDSGLSADSLTQSSGTAVQQASGSSRNATAAAEAQREFFVTANAQAVKGVMQAVESQANRILPEGVSNAARNRMIGEIYRELDASLQSNTEFAKQVKGAFRSGNLDSAHQNALVSLIVGRARQALPGVAKRVVNEWTSTVLATNQDRRTKQRSAESRVDIGGTRGGGTEGHRARSSRAIDYGRMSDADILNL
jgi:hypothetical protein